MLYETSKLNKVDIGHHEVGPEGVGHGVEPKEVCNRRHQAIDRHEKYVSGGGLPEARGSENQTSVPGGTYQYLRIKQVFKSDHTSVRDRLMAVYVKRLHQIWSSALSS